MNPQELQIWIALVRAAYEAGAEFVAFVSSVFRRQGRTDEELNAVIEGVRAAIQADKADVDAEIAALRAQLAAQG